jgi:hypothetical protein
VYNLNDKPWRRKSALPNIETTGEIKMKVHTTFLPAFALFSAFALPLPAHAVQGFLWSPVQSILLTSEAQTSPNTGLVYGGCMAYLAQPINTASNSPNCPSNYVAFSCDGTYVAKDTAQMMLDQAQLAYVLKKTVVVMVDDAKKHNGYCTATRLDIW